MFHLFFQILSNNQHPIHVVIDSFCPENVKAFLKSFDKSSINVKYNHENALHILCELLTNENYANVSECIKILLTNECNPNLPNEKNQTAFYVILKKQPKLAKPKELVEFFLDNSNVDLYTYRQEEMLHKFKMQNSHRKVPEQQIQNIDQKFMMKLVIEKRENEFEAYFKAFKEILGGNSQIYHDECAKFLEMAAIKGAPNIVKLLFEHETIDVSVRAQGATWKYPPSFVACMQGYYKIVEMFLKQRSLKFDFIKLADKDFVLDKDSRSTLLHEVCLRFGKEPTKDPNVDYKKCFDLLIEDHRCTHEMINLKDSYGCTALHYTTRYKQDEATLALLKKSAHICIRNNLDQMALNDIKKETFENFLDESIESVSKRNKKTHMYVFGHDEQQVSIDYSFLIPPTGKENREIEPLYLISHNKELRELIKHPVLFSFIFIKWSKLSLLFYINFIMFSMFMSSLIFFIVHCQTIAPEERTKNTTYMIFYGFSVISVVMLIIREFLQCIFSFKNYFKSKMNWFEMVLIILSVFVLLDLFDDNFQRIIRGFTILLAATEFLTLAGTLPNLSVSTHMVILKTVILTFLKSIALYSILLFGFALCFFTIFGPYNAGNTNSTLIGMDDGKSHGDSHQDAVNGFINPGVAIIKTLVMLTGEFEFGNLEIQETSNYIIFVLFVFIITIVLFNLLNALAISDTQIIKAEGQLTDLIQRISVLDKYERIISNGNSAIARWMKGTVKIFGYWIPTGKVYVFPSENNELKTLRREEPRSINNAGDEEMQNLNNNSSRETSTSFQNIVINGWLPKSFHRVATLDKKIMKEIKYVTERKIERESDEGRDHYRKHVDKKLLRDVVSIKIQNYNLQRELEDVKKRLNSNVN